ncbi:putative Xaa-Pro aminopeptidase P [Nymphon striatum]|nr:putative Xaa-Pro aminopeptidase P [Nymphon striatum]
MNASKENVVAYDPWLITINQLKAFEKSANKSKSKLKPVENLIDRIWADQPSEPMGTVSLHDIKYAGKSAEDKISEIQAIIEEKACNYTLLTDPASLAWLFNIRGNDLIHNPLALGYAIVPACGKPLLFMDERKLDLTVKAYLNDVSTLFAPQEFEAELRKLAHGKTALCDPDLVSVALAQIIENADGTIIHGRDPVVLPRAMKNEAEQKGTRSAHIRDGVAMAKFLCWLDSQAGGTLTEIDTAKKLEAIRKSNAEAMQSELKEISFDTISASGPHAALPHYRVSEASNRILGDGEIYLVDSGAQHDDGTTDITRTISNRKAAKRSGN